MRGRSTTAVMSQKAVTDAIDAGGGGGGGGREFEPVGCMKFLQARHCRMDIYGATARVIQQMGIIKLFFEIIGTEIQPGR